MNRIKQYFLKQGLKNAHPSTKAITSNDPKVTVLTRNLIEIEVVKSHFSWVDYVYYEDLKRPKDTPTKTSHLYKDDLDYKGVPKRTIPEPEGNHILINLEPNPPILSWYWSARSYDLKVDLCNVYPQADIQIGPGKSDTLGDKIEMLKKTLNIITK
jgi:hypothetical protein